MIFGKRNTGARKVTSEQVERMRARYEAGETQASLSREFRLSVGQVGRIVRGESWQGSAGLAPAADDGALERLLAAQSETNAVRSPPSLLDGGNAPSETGGAGAQALAEARAKEFGAK